LTHAVPFNVEKSLVGLCLLLPVLRELLIDIGGRDLDNFVNEAIEVQVRMLVFQVPVLVLVLVLALVLVLVLVLALT